MLSQTMTIWFKLVSQQNLQQYIDNIDHNEAATYAYMVYDIFDQILDPCHAFDTIDPSKDVRVSVESVISKVPRLYDG